MTKSIKSQSKIGHFKNNKYRIENLLRKIKMKSKKNIIIAALVIIYIFAGPCLAGISVIGSLVHRKDVTPGENHKGTVTLFNKDDVPQEVRIYQTDYLCFADGSNLYGEPGKLKRSNANWITFSPRQIIIPAQATITVNYTIKVPNGDDLIGTYWSMLMVEQVPDDSPLSSKGENARIDVGIRQIVRYGIQITTDISDTGERKLNFTNTKLINDKQKRTLQLDIENVGQRLLRPFVWVEVYNSKGEYVGKFEAERKRIYPGSSVRYYSMDLTILEKGQYQALVVADCSDDFIFGTNHILNIL